MTKRVKVPSWIAQVVLNGGQRGRGVDTLIAKSMVIIIVVVVVVSVLKLRWRWRCPFLLLGR